jgi:hypothetical protein
MRRGHRRWSRWPPATSGTCWSGASTSATDRGTPGCHGSRRPAIRPGTVTRWWKFGPRACARSRRRRLTPAFRGACSATTPDTALVTADGHIRKRPASTAGGAPLRVGQAQVDAQPDDDALSRRTSTGYGPPFSLARSARLSPGSMSTPLSTIASPFGFQPVNGQRLADSERGDRPHGRGVTADGDRLDRYAAGGLP